MKLTAARSTFVATIASLTFAALHAPAFGESILFNTDTGVMTIDGTPQTNFFGVPVQSSIVNGVTRFRFFGDLAFISSDVVGATGARPLSLLGGNDVRVASGAVFNFDVGGQIGKLGGGNGGAAVSGGAAGSGRPGGFLTIGGAGGLGGYTDINLVGHDGEPGTKGGDGSPGIAGLAGIIGAAGNQGAPGFANPSGVSPAGAAGPRGEPGPAPGVSTGADGGPGGRNFALAGGAGEDGTRGDDADDELNGNDGGDGGNGTGGGGGRNELTGLLLSGGAGGSSGGSGGGGGGGSGGSSGAGGGGGGGGGLGLFIFVAENGGTGGLGGFGGSGGSGGNGAAGGGSGTGGAGAGAIEIAAQGRLSFNGTITARGASAGSRTIPGTRQSGSPGASGTDGFPGTFTPTGFGGHGGEGGDGADGGDGGNGGFGGPGGHSGGGAGGTVLFKSSLFDAAGASINTSGGPSLGSPGGNGRYVTSDNGGVAANYGTFTGANREQFIGLAARDANPFVTGGATTTANVVNLVGGADVYGIKQGVSALDPYFEQIRTAAPLGAVAAVLRRAVGPSQLVGPTQTEQYASSELLMMVNLTDQPLAAPTLGVGPAGAFFNTPLLQRGFANNPLFNPFLAVVPTTLENLPAHAVFATLVNTGDNALTVNASAAGAIMAPTAFGALDVQYLLPFIVILAGDYDDDVDVDGADFLTWQRAFGKPAGALPNDFTNLPIGAEQLKFWIQSFGAVTPTPIPEPTAVVHLIAIAAAVSALRRKLHLHEPEA